MKKLMMFLSLCGLLLCVSCIKKWDEKIPCIWQIGNATDQRLILRCPYYESLSQRGLEYQEFEILQQSVITIYRDRVPVEDKPYFNYYFKKIFEKFGEDVSWQILSLDGTVLKTWTYSDRGLPDQRLFEESSWNPDDRDGSLWYYLGFGILPEDIIEE